MLYSFSAQTHCIITKTGCWTGQAEGWFRCGSTGSFQEVNKYSKSLWNLCRQPWCHKQLSFCSCHNPSAEPPDNREADEHIGRIKPDATSSHSPSEIEIDPDTGTQNRQLLRKVRKKNLGREHNLKCKHKPPEKEEGEMDTKEERNT